MSGWATGGRGGRIARRAVQAVAVLLGLWLLAWLAVPPLLKWQAQQRLGQALGRTVTIGAVDFRPWSLVLELRDLAVAAAPASASASASAASEPQLRVARLHLNASAASLLRRAPVLEALEIDGLRLRLAHTAPGHYDVDDLIARFAPAPGEPDGEPARFALYNVQLRDAELSFDDRPAQRVHRVDGLTLTLPFVSNLPSQVDVTVEPRLAFRLNGTPFDSGAQATPFAQSHQGELKLAFADLDLAPYLGYLPATLPVRLQRGAVSADLRVRFALPEGGTPNVVVLGRAGARDLAIADAASAPLVGWRRLELGLRDVQPFARTLAFDRLHVEGLALQVSRGADGGLNLMRLAAAPATSPPGAAASGASAPTGGAAPSPWTVRLDTLELADAQLRWNDALTHPAAALQLDGLALQAREILWPMRAAVPLTLKATLKPQADGTAAAGRIEVDGSASDREARLGIRLDGLALPALAPYLAQAVAPAVEGTLSAQGRFDWAGDAAAPRLALTLDSATLADARLVEGSGRAARPALALKQLDVEGLELDVIARLVAIAKLELAQPSAAIARDRDGRWNAARWLAAAATTPAAAPAKPATAAPPWRVQLKALALDGGRLAFADAFASGRAMGTPVRVEVAALRMRLQDASWPAARGVAPAKLQLGLRVGGPARARDVPGVPGTLDWNGRLTPEPFAADGTLRIERLPVHLFEAYFGEAVNLSLLRAEAGWKGQFALQSLASGWRVKAAGDARLTDVRVHTRPDGATPAGLAATDELLSWQSFALDGLRFEMAPGRKPQLEIREAALNDFYSRLVITEEGRFNLRDVAAAPADAASAPSAAASAANAPRAPRRGRPRRPAHRPRRRPTTCRSTSPSAACSSATAASTSPTASCARTTAPRSAS